MVDKITSRRYYDQYVIDEIEKICNALNLPRTVIDESINIFSEVAKKKLTRSRELITVVATCVYIACRKLKVPRSIDEIAEVSKVDRDSLARLYRLLVTELGLKMPVIEPEEYVESIGRQLNLSDSTIKKALQIMEIVRQKGYNVGKDPAGIAGSAIYIASLIVGEWATQKDISKVANVTDVTVRNRAKEILELLKGTPLEKEVQNINPRKKKRSVV